jgi:hypothetical protein
VAAALVGVVNAVMIFEGGIPPFIAALATMTMGRGLINLITNAAMIIGLPEGFLNFGGASYLGIPSQFWVWMVLAAILAFLLTRTRLGRNFYAIGTSQEVARLSGINLRKPSIPSVSSVPCSRVSADWCSPPVCAWRHPRRATATSFMPSPPPSSVAPASMEHKARRSARSLARGRSARAAAAAMVARGSVLKANISK